jgi:hypothetical protein
MTTVVSDLLESDVNQPKEPAIFSVVCNERDGPITRSVYPLRLSRANIKKFWESSLPFPTLFSDEIGGDFRKFCELFLSEENGVLKAHGLFWVVDDFVGVFSMTHITDIEAVAHYTFFDRKQRGREELTKEMLRYAFRKFGFRRISTECPKYVSVHTINFVHSLGFTQEGVKRKAARYKGDWFDVRCFGILREEMITDEQ